MIKLSIKVEDIKAFIKSFKYNTPAEPITIQDKLNEIVSDTENHTDPKKIAEKLSYVLQEELNSLTSMDKGEFNSLIEDISNKLVDSFQEIHPIWTGGLTKNLSGLKQVWIACEPMLDLVDGKDGAYQLLKSQLKIAEKIIYFQSEKKYYDYLIGKLKKERFERKFISKLKFVRLQAPYKQNIALYHKDKMVSGVIGKFTPPIKKNNSDIYYLEKKLPKEWMSFLSETSVKRHKENLEKYLQKR